MEASQVTPAEIMSGFQSEDSPATLSGYPPEIQQDVEGLTHLGYLEDDFDFCGHHFVIRTLRGDEELLAALACKEYLETLGQARAWNWAQIAMSLVAIDGQEDFCPPLGPDKRAYAKARFRYVTGNWFWNPMGRKLSEKFGELLERADGAAKVIEDLSEGNQLMSTPFAGSSIDKGDSEEQEDIREYLDPPASTESK